MSLCEKIVCQFCAKTFQTISSCRRHEKNFHGKVYRKYKCSVCEFSCSKKYELLEHDVANHAVASPVPIVSSSANHAVASTSVQIFSTSASHAEIPKLMSVSLPPIYLCQICKKRFASKSNCQRHEKKFHSILYPKYKCPRCEFSCSMNDELLEHIEVNHIEESNPLPVQSSSTYSCPHCGEMFDEFVALTKHKKIHATSRIRFLCSICRKSFSSIQGCRRHKNIFHANFKEKVSNMQQNGISNSLSSGKGVTERQALIKEKPHHETLENLRSSATSLIMSFIPEIQQYSEEQCKELIKVLSILKRKCEAIKAAENSEKSPPPVASTSSSLRKITIQRVFLLKKKKNL